MNRVYSSLHQREITAAQFCELNREQQQEAKPGLTCIGCDEAAWFSRPSEHMAAHFRSRHIDSCDLSAGQVAVNDEAEDAEDVFTIDLAQTNAGMLADRPVEPRPREAGDDARFTAVGNVVRRNRTINGSLYGLLRRLNNNADFASSADLLRLRDPSGENYIIDAPLRNVVHRSNNLNEVSADDFSVVWGTILSASQTSDNALWLNFDSSVYRGFSVLIPEDSIPLFCDLYSLPEDFTEEDLDVLEGARALVVGRVNRSQNGKPFTRCAAPDHYLVIRNYR